MLRVQRRTTGPSARPIETRDPDKRERHLAETVKWLSMIVSINRLRASTLFARTWKIPCCKSKTKPKSSPNCEGTYWLFSSLAMKPLKAISLRTAADIFIALFRTWSAPAPSSKYVNIRKPLLLQCLTSALWISVTAPDASNLATSQQTNSCSSAMLPWLLKNAFGGNDINGRLYPSLSTSSTHLLTPISFQNARCSLSLPFTGVAQANSTFST